MSKVVANIEDFTITPDSRPDNYQSATLGFGLDGKPCQADTPLCLAKSALNQHTKVQLFYIRTKASGYNGNTYFNPLSDSIANLSQMEYGTSQPKYPFKVVTKAAFDYYLQFLKTGSTVYLRNAERAI